MSLQGQSELREDDVSGGPKLALDALNNLTPSNQAKPYNPLFPPPRPALASDPKPKPSGNDLEADDKSWSMSTISTTLSSLLYRENTGTSSAATSRSNSANFEGIFQQVRTSTPLAISRWSTWTTDFIEQGSSEEGYPSINKGAVYALARETFRVGTYRGYVDTWQSLRDKWQEKIWTMVENPKAVVEVC
jgi:hypothetical protein